VALLVAGAVVVFGDGGQGGRAYASWTAAPEPVANHDLDAAKAACENKLHHSAGESTAIDPSKAKLALAERRGTHVALLYRTDNPDISTTCFMRNRRGSTKVDDLELGSGGSTGPALTPLSTGFTQGAIAEFRGAAVTVTDGAVGSDVRGVTIHSGDLTITATLDNGRYAAWWPGSAFDGGRLEAQGRRAPKLNLRYDLTLTDGSLVQDAKPTRPS